jgi:hypothetical protein
MTFSLREPLDEAQLNIKLPRAEAARFRQLAKADRYTLGVFLTLLKTTMRGKGDNATSYHIVTFRVSILQCWKHYVGFSHTDQMAVNVCSPFPFSGERRQSETETSNGTCPV